MICFPYRNRFVCQSGWWRPALRMFPIHLSPLLAIHLSPGLAGGVRLSGCFQFICLPLRQFICFPVLLVVPGSLHVSDSCVFPYSNSFFSQSGWWCRALGISPIHLSPLKAIHLLPSLAGGVRLSGCLHFICLPLKHFICLAGWLVASGSPDVSNSFVSPYSNSFLPVWLVVSGSPDVSNSFVSPYSNSFLPVWLVVSGSTDVSNSFVFPYSNSFVSQSGLWCRALGMSPIHLSPLIAIHLSPSVACGGRLSRCLRIHLSPLITIHFVSPVWLVVSGSSACLQFICLRV